jgi:hypothetical protein
MAKRNVRKALPAPVEAAPQAAPLLVPRFSSLWRLFIYPLSILVPGAGIALGLLYARQEDPQARNFGRLCILWGLLGLALRMTHGFQGPDTLYQPLY